VKQSRLMSAVESATNVAVGFGVAVATQALVFPLFGIHASMGQHFAIGALFTVVSVIRSYALRRFFEAVRVRGTEKTEKTALGAVYFKSRRASAQEVSSGLIR
jgi:hypothetical protein